ncbi:prolyl 4-hydroxylase subunit alpha-1-like isoform X2 [Ruditapes philippinarum]|uniref:prolyl 4-hydroxylase subunit alpha-1-like isoform X2 n=1 Tax=Ruditapes philippinarum TaxID=129788 RepID=UPI00295AB17C|nr:prolyl 4-hydroxylase subunit alpha-1-like isoform X2 [Ruditapes philippinarum]
MIWMLIIASVAALGSGELFSSLAHLQTALYTERDISKEIRHYIYEEQERLEKLTQLADEFEKHSEKALEDPDLYLGNPVNAYLFVKHFTIDWDNEIDIVIKNNSRTELYNKIEEMRENLPNYEDLTGSVSALLRLQDTYKLETNELARGNVGGVASPELTAWDCYELGRLAYNTEDYYHTIMWMEEALAKIRQFHDEGVDENIVAILDYLAFAQYKQGNVRRALTLTNEMLALSPDHTRAQGNKDYYERMLREEDETAKRGDDGEVTNKRQLDEYRSGEEYMAYEALCRNETVKENKYKHKLFCRYRTNNHPLLIISPAKEEVLYLNPFLSVFHNSISDREIKLIQTLATPKLGRATVHNPKTGKLETAGYRVSKSCWLSDYDSPEIARVNARIAATTGLNMETAEELQIANYGIGGQYEPHFDFARKREPTAFERRIGNRIATYMYYMSDVQAGGATVFPYLGLKIFPEKGKSVFWYNLYKNGEGIFDTRHAACPVLVGSKWVSNKWIHERGQEFKRPCGLRESE